METEEYKGYTIKLYQDELAESPRTAFDNLGVMACWHTRYNLGDEKPRESKPADYLYTVLRQWYSDDYLGKNRDECNDQEFILWALEKLEAHAIVLPLVLLYHSGLCMCVGTSFSEDPGGWDTSRVGFIYMTNEIIRANYGKRLTLKIQNTAEKGLRSEVKEYSSYLEGDVYFYQVVDKDGEDVESCGGFYGHEYAIQSAKESIDYLITTKEIQHESRG